MIVEHLTTQTLSLEDCIVLSVSNNANNRPGTSMRVLGPVVAEKFDLEYTEASDKGELLAHLAKGGEAIVNVAEKPDGTPGLFTRAGHYMVLISADGEQICFFDPNYTAEAYGKGELKEKVDSSKAPFLSCSLDLLWQETEAREIRFYLFKRK